MQKGIFIKSVIISNGRVDVINDRGDSIKVTRQQRMLLGNYKNKNYIEDVIKAFSNPNVFDSEFKVTKDGNVVFEI